nr:putative reverse transcriptase domain-containing protein [Tanacetum cinerariifolium]
MLTVNFSNAFNLVDRSALLHEYLDDETVIRYSEEVSRVLDIIKVSGPGLGLELNIKKTEIFWPSCNGMKLREDLFPVDIRRPSSGVNLLGGVISGDANYPQPNRDFGLLGSGGVEAVLQSVNRVLSEYYNDGSLAMLTVNFSNAFNLVDRSTLLHEQSDPLGPLPFALILHPLLHKIKNSCKLLLHAWYLDDETVIRDSEEVFRVLDIIKVSGPGLGLELNIKKTEIFWPSCNGMKLREGLFPVDIRRPSSGVNLLGGVISRDAN